MQNLDIVMPMNNLLEYNDNYSMTSGSLWNYYRDKAKDPANEIYAANNNIINKKTIKSKSFDYKSKLIGKIPNDNSRLNAEAFVWLISLSNSWRSLDLPLINCKVELDLTWSKNCVISEILRTLEVKGANPVATT